MEANHIPPFDNLDTPKGVCVADGHGIKIRVDRRHLVVEDGIGRSRRERRFHKATSGLKRVIILGTTGYISLEAVRWIADASIPMVQVDPEGRLLTASQPMGSDRAALRRAQAWALTNETGLEVVRYLLDRKLEGQAHVAAELGGDRSEIDDANRQLEAADSLDELMWLEAQAANLYWHAWTKVECRFITRDQARVPDHWRRFGTRALVSIRVVPVGPPTRRMRSSTTCTRYWKQKLCSPVRSSVSTPEWASFIQTNGQETRSLST